MKKNKPWKYRDTKMEQNGSESEVVNYREGKGKGKLIILKGLSAGRDNLL